jgi:hypothetical protein
VEEVVSLGLTMQMDGWMDGWMNGWMDEWMNGG